MSARLLTRLAAPAAWAAVPLALAVGLAPASASTNRWRVVATAGPAKGATYVAGFAASGAANAWSAWSFCGPCGGAHPASGNLLRRWDGHRWRRVAVPGVVSSDKTSLIALATSSPRDTWVFLDAIGGKGRAARWNGRAWSVRKLPSWVLRITRAGTFNVAAAAFGPGNVWVFSEDAETRPTLAAHYQGGRWHKVRLPGVPGSVSALSSADIWAAGVTARTATLTGSRQAHIAMHWNGHAWRSMKLPKLKVPKTPSAYRAVGDVVALGSRDVWMLDGVSTGGNPPREHLLNWNGKRWTRKKLGYPTADVVSMAQDGHGGLWLDANGAAPSYTAYLYHESRGHWSRQRVPAPSGNTPQLQTLTWVPGGPSLWGGGELFPTRGSDIHGAIWRYGH